MLETATSVLPVARTRGTAGDACATAALHPGGLCAAPTPRGAEHVTIAVRFDLNGAGSGITLPGSRVQPHALATWPTSSRPTSFRPTIAPRGESSAPSRPV